MATTYLKRLPASNGSNTTGTLSAWIKREAVGSAQCCAIGGEEGTDANNRIFFGFWSDDTLALQIVNGGTAYEQSSAAKFRDPAAWYHIVARLDTTNGVAQDRIKLYVNGTQITTYTTNSTFPSSVDIKLFENTTSCETLVGARKSGSTYNNISGGSMSHVHVIDGTAYDASTFGETDATSGIWKIKTSPTVTYGTNGFFLKFEDRTNLDLDSGTNTFTNFTTTGTLTATYDNPSDNFATLNPLHESDPSGNYVLSNGNTTLTVTSNDYQRQVGVTILPAGLKGYFEWKAVDDSNYQQGFQVTSIKLGKTNYDTAATGDIYFLTGDPMRISYSNGGSAANWITSYFSTWAEGDIMGCAFDFTGSNRNVWFSRNGTYGNNGSGVGDPAAGTYPAMTSTQLPVTKEFEITHASNSGATAVTSFNFGNGYFGTTAIASAGTNASGIGTFEYDVPTGFTALSTKGLNE